MLCKICSGDTFVFDTATILNKYFVKYYKCLDCGFICAEHPYWLNEAYSEAISALDVGLIGRNLNNAPVLARILDTLYQTSEGGGDFPPRHIRFHI